MVGPAETPDDTFQEVRALRAPIEEMDLEIEAVVGDHEPGNTPTGTEIDDAGARGEPGEGGDERPGVIDDLGDGAGPEEAEGL